MADDTDSIAGTPSQAHKAEDASSRGRLYESIPALGAMPVPGQRARSLRAVRLVSTTPGADLSIELQPGVNRIGRQREHNHIVLVSPQISRLHGEVDVRHHDLIIRDLGSGNGTYVNGQRVAERALKAGDLIAFSDKFTFRVHVDLIERRPDTLTLEAAGPNEPQLPEATSKQPEETAPQAVPKSLEVRAAALKESAPDLSAEALAATIESAPVTVDPNRPLEIAPQGHAPPFGDPTITGANTPTPAMPLPSIGDVARPRQPRPIPIPAPSDSFPPDDLRGEKLPPTRSGTTRPGPGPADAEDEEVGQQAHRGESATEGAQQMDDLTREKDRLAVLYQVSKRCMSAQSLAELDSVLVNVLERTTAFDRGFIAYQLPSGDWKLVMSPKGDRWERHVVRGLIRTALNVEQAIVVRDSSEDDKLGTRDDGTPDQRVLLPLRSGDQGTGAIFLMSRKPDSLGDDAVDFLSLFADIASLAVVSCGRLDNTHS